MTDDCRAVSSDAIVSRQPGDGAFTRCSVGKPTDSEDVEPSGESIHGNGGSITELAGKLRCRPGLGVNPDEGGPKPEAIVIDTWDVTLYRVREFEAREPGVELVCIYGRAIMWPAPGRLDP